MKENPGMKPTLAQSETDAFAGIRSMAPERLLEFLDQVLLIFPDEFRFRLKQVLDSVPASGDNMHKVLEVVRRQWQDIRSESWVNIAVTGPAQTGKSSLVEALLQKQASDVAPIFGIAETPGLQEYLGFQAADASTDLEKADLILLVLDARYAVSEMTAQILSKVKAHPAPALVVLNKIDLAEDPGAAIREARLKLKRSVFATSIYRSETLDKLLKAMVVANPKTLYPLAQSFPGFRRTLCTGIITQASMAAGLVSAIPIPVSDLFPITAIQTAMILKISRAFGCKLDRKRARELVPMLLAGVLIREGGHRLRQRFRRQRHLISLAVGGTWTFLLGQMAVRYFENAGRLLGECEGVSARSR